MVDDGVAVAVELGGHHLLRDGHAHGVGEPLAQRAGGGLDAGRVAEFRVAGGGAAELPEVFQVVQADAVAGQVQQAVEQHGAVAVGEHEPVAVDPVRVGRVVLQEAAPQHFGDIRHAHGGARVTRLGFLYRIHAQGTDSIGEITGSGG